MLKYRIPTVMLILVVTIIALAIVGPIPQDLSYHDFGDNREIVGIPNFWNVMSNLPMLFLGIAGIYFSLRTWSLRPDLVAKLLPLFLSIGIFGACFGSAYYHYNPNNNTLVWDRLPMTLMFMPLFTLLIYDFIGKIYGKLAFYLLIPLGIFSVFYWQHTESVGSGDLRFYAFVQFFPMLMAPIIIWLYPKKVKYIRYIILVLLWYIVAKISEHYDKEIFDMLGFWSGHTVKHLVASISLFYILLLLLSWEKSLLRTEAN